MNSLEKALANAQAKLDTEKVEIASPEHIQLLKEGEHLPIDERLKFNRLLYLSIIDS